MQQDKLVLTYNNSPYPNHYQKYQDGLNKPLIKRVDLKSYFENKGESLIKSLSGKELI